MFQYRFKAEQNNILTFLEKWWRSRSPEIYLHRWWKLAKDNKNEMKRRITINGKNLIHIET